eukprot:TRINITY_DN18303_c0_g1_i1.p1 TRINITY_DN18303_c0_g1~~TRINITY_DN18303_c0_g1_i1.p1  ORF type:complete len:229 (-),score=34.97 TRINITY_DN18303_c0_g1_i1:457-1098(-)
MDCTVVLCVRHIPCKILEAGLQEAMRGFGLDVARYDVFFPKRLGRHGQFNNFGYGFITCRHAEDAEAFVFAMQGYHFEHVQSGKRLAVERARGPSRLMGVPFRSTSSARLEPHRLDLEEAGVTDDASGTSSDGEEAPPTDSARHSFFVSSFGDHTLPASVDASGTSSDGEEAPPTDSASSSMKIPHELVVPPTRLAVYEGQRGRSMMGPGASQ